MSSCVSVPRRQARTPKPIFSGTGHALRCARATTGRQAPSGAERRCMAPRHLEAAKAVWKGQDDAGPVYAPPQAPRHLKYRRVMLKLSGEALEGEHGFGIDPNVLRKVAKEVATAAAQGVQIAIVVGGGNFFRGVNRWDGLERTTADYVGMLATVMNAISLQSALEHEGVQTRVQTAIEMREVAEPYIRRRAIRHLERGRVVIFGGGTGNPFFTTDTAAALRAAEIGAEVYLKATQVDGVYDRDPAKNTEARRYSHVSYRKCVLDDLKVLDETAFTLCKENGIPVVVFDIHKSGNIVKAVNGDDDIGTRVDSLADHPHDLEPQRTAAQSSIEPAAAHVLLSHALLGSGPGSAVNGISDLAAIAASPSQGGDSEANMHSVV